jgi:hypothetical protein
MKALKRAPAHLHSSRYCDCLSAGTRAELSPPAEIELSNPAPNCSEGEIRSFNAAKGRYPLLGLTLRDFRFQKFIRPTRLRWLRTTCGMRIARPV